MPVLDSESHRVLLWIFLLLPSLSACESVPGERVGQKTRPPGPYPPEVAAWDEATREQQRLAGKKLIEAIQEAAREGRKSFVVPRGHYRFKDTEKQNIRRVHIQLIDLEDMTIDGDGSTFWFETDQQAIRLRGCKNVTIRNLTLDWDPLGFTQGTVEEVDCGERTLLVRIDPGYERVTPRFAALPPTTGGTPFVRGTLMDSTTGRIKQNQVGWRVVPFFGTPRERGCYRIRVLTHYQAPMEALGARAGDRVVFWVRGEGGFLTAGCQDLVLEDINMYSCAGFLFREVAGVGPNVFRRCRALKRPGTNRLMGGNSDAFHSSNMEYGPLIEDCEVEAIGDDFVNVHGFYGDVLSQQGPATLIVSYIAWRKTLKKDLTVHFLQNPDLRLVGTRTAATAEFLHWKIEKDKYLAVPRHHGRNKPIAYGKVVPAHRLRLTAPIRIEPDTIFACDDYTGQGVIIRGNLFRNGLVRGVLLQTHDATIQGNRFEWMGRYAMAIRPSTGYWGESTHPHHVRILDNTMEDTGRNASMQRGAIAVLTPGDLSVTRLQHDIEISRNTITRPGGAGILVRGARNVRITDNTVRGYADLAPMRVRKEDKDAPFGFGHGIILEGVRGLVLERNELAEPGAFGKGEVAKKDTR